MSHSSRIALVVGAAFALTVGTGTAATAAGNDSYTSRSPDDGAEANFYSSGELFTLWDIECDGQVPRLQYKVGSGGSVTTVENHNGCNSDSTLVDKSWPEKTVIYFRACNIGGGDDNCGAWVKATA